MRCAVTLTLSNHSMQRKTSAGSLISEKAWTGVTTTAVYKVGTSKFDVFCIS